MKINISVDELIIIVNLHGFFCKILDRKNNMVTLVIENNKSKFDERIIISDDTVQYVCKANVYYWSSWSEDNVKECPPLSFNELSDLKFMGNYVE